MNPALVIISCFFIFVYTSAQGNFCFDCEDGAVHPAVCGKVKRCAQDEVCFAEERKGLNGGNHFVSGCRKQSHCVKTSTAPPSQGHSNVTCSECCKQDGCNAHLCSSSAISSQRAKICFNCDYVDSPHHCDSVTVCRDDQICGIEHQKKFTFDLFNLGCIYSKYCNNRTTLSNNNYACCSSDFCNFYINVTTTTSASPAATASATTSPVITNTTAATTTAVNTTASSLPNLNTSTTVTSTSNVSISTTSLNGTVAVSVTTAATTAAAGAYATASTSPNSTNAALSINSYVMDVTLHADVNLTCNVNVPTSSPITWDYDKTTIFNAKANGNILTIHHVTKENAGNYTCLVGSNQQSASGLVTVRINEPVRVKIERPVMEIPNNVLRLRCDVTGDPRPSVTWHKMDGPPIAGNGKDILNFGDEILFVGVSPGNAVSLTGVYVCNASNNYTYDVGYQAVVKVISAKITCDFPISFASRTPGVCLKVTCPACPGNTAVNSTSIFPITDLLCSSAVTSGVIDNKGGDVIYLMRKNHTAQFVDVKNGKLII